jgi:hypothetical protein
MSILLSGDFHANATGEIFFITKRTLKKRYGINRYSRIKYHVILGDGGFMWPGNFIKDIQNYEILRKRNFPVLCVLGNHEPIYGMANLSEVDIGIGEKVYQIYDNSFVAYLKRGKIYHIDGFKFLVLGGAYSIDVGRRTPGLSWWKEEYWSEKEKKSLFKLLKKENEFDFILSHTGPDSINRIILNSVIETKWIIDNVAVLNDELCKKIKFKEWYCGHLHRDQYYFDSENKRGFQYLHRETRLLDKIEDKILVYK